MSSLSQVTDTVYVGKLGMLTRGWSGQNADRESERCILGRRESDFVAQERCNRLERGDGLPEASCRWRESAEGGAREPLRAARKR